MYKYFLMYILSTAQQYNMIHYTKDWDKNVHDFIFLNSYPVDSVSMTWNEIL